MSRNLFSIKIDTKAVEALAGDLSKLDGEKLSEAMIAATNEAGKTAYDLSRKAILRSVKLTEGYVDKKVKFNPAGAKARVAEIVAEGSVTGLGHYGALQRWKPVRWPDPLPGMKIGRWPFRYVPRLNDEKPAGVSVEVKSGSRKDMRGAFTIKKNGATVRDSEGNPVLFLSQEGTQGQGSKKDTTRQNRKTGRTKIDRLAGPSVYQLFRTAATAIEDDVRADLEGAVVRYATAEIEKVLK